MRTPPPWLIADDFTDVELGTLRAGKEAQVRLVERRADDRSCLLVYKLFIPLHVTKGELHDLGFEGARQFTNDATYRADKRLAKRSHREQRAMTKRTAYGRELMFKQWSAQEYATLIRLWDADVSVPYPVDGDRDRVIMEYVGDRASAAPQLVQAALDASELCDAYEQWLTAMRGMVAARVVHGDLSPYNILWWNDRLVVIDFPQAIDLVNHPKGFDLLHRDIANVGTWFQRKGKQIDIDAIYADVIAAL